MWTKKTIRVLSRRLNEKEKAALLAEGAEATDWIYAVIKEICKGEEKMIEIAKLPADDRRELFHNTAAKTGLHDAIVEKEFLGMFDIVLSVPPFPVEKGGHI